MNQQQIKIVNGRVIMPMRIINHGTVLVTGDKITEVREGDIEAPNAVVLDAGGQYISPGFIDIHIHGGGGHDFMDGTVEAFLEIAKCHARYGTTAMNPTTLTSEMDGLMNTLDLYKQANANNTEGARFIGMHLEGPYFAMNQRGAQDPRYIRNPDPEEYRKILNHSDGIARWSAAPELEGALEFARYVRSKGVLVALAHTDAIYEEVLEGFENGYTLATHLYSGMSGVSRRNAYRFAGVIESAFLIDEMSVEVIADGKHLPAALLKLIYKIKGPDRIALITDSIRGAGMPDGETTLGNIHTGIKAIIEDGVAKLPDRSSFAGSVATTDRLVRTMLQVAQTPLIETIKMMTLTPATIMGVADKIGSLVAGKDADIVIFDENINIQKTMIKGKIVYSKTL